MTAPVYESSSKATFVGFFLTVNSISFDNLLFRTLLSHHKSKVKALLLLWSKQLLPFISSCKTFLRCSGNRGLLSLLHFNITAVWPSDQTLGPYVDALLHECLSRLFETQNLS